MRRGILIKSGSALERLATITHAVFDKTGTLTLGLPALQDSGFPMQDADFQLAASLAAHSKHPLSQAITRAYTGPLLALDAKEVVGCGVEASGIKLGKAAWCGVAASSDDALELWLAVDGKTPMRFTFADPLRDDASLVIATLQAAHIPSELLSGDRAEVVSHVATKVGIADASAALSPLQKCDRLKALKEAGARALMVGDGLNDAPSLASAHVSMSPASAMDITQNAADIVFQGNQLQPVITAWRVACFSQKLVKENFTLAVLYNVIAIPLAVAGFVTPLIAAIAMSSSSLLVIGNAPPQPDEGGHMNVLMYLIPIALTLGLAGLAAFLWAARNGQFDDLDGAAHRVLREDDEEV